MATSAGSGTSCDNSTNGREVFGLTVAHGGGSNQSPTGRKRRAVGRANQKIVIEVPNRSLMNAIPTEQNEIALVNQMPDVFITAVTMLPSAWPSGAIVDLELVLESTYLSV